MIMPEYNNTDPRTNPTFQRNDRIGKSWRKRYAKENNGAFVNTGEGWSWKSNASATPKPVVVSKTVVVNDEEE